MPWAKLRTFKAQQKQDGKADAGFLIFCRPFPRGCGESQEGRRGRPVLISVRSACAVEHGRDGGQMAEQKVRARAGAGKKAASGKAGGSAARKSRGTAQAKRSAPGGRKPEAGFESLRKAAVKELVQGGEQIAKKLREKSEAGDTQSTKLLIELASKPRAKKPAKAKSVALEIAAEREWEEGPATAGPAEVESAKGGEERPGENES